MGQIDLVDEISGKKVIYCGRRSGFCVCGVCVCGIFSIEFVTCQKIPSNSFAIENILWWNFCRKSTTTIVFSIWRCFICRPVSRIQAPWGSWSLIIAYRVKWMLKYKRPIKKPIVNAIFCSKTRFHLLSNVYPFFILPHDFVCRCHPQIYYFCLKIQIYINVINLNHEKRIRCYVQEIKDELI